MKPNKKAKGDLAEELVCSKIKCPVCKGGRLRRLPANFPCADVICSFCGSMAQVKYHTVTNPEVEYVSRLPGATWKTQKRRIEAGTCLPIYVVLYFRDEPIRILYLPIEFQLPEVFRRRRGPLRREQKFDYHFGWETKRFFVPVWEKEPWEDDHGRIKLTEVSEASFSQVAEKKTWLPLQRRRKRLQAGAK
jgi:hypothetical protein